MLIMIEESGLDLKMYGNNINRDIKKKKYLEINKKKREMYGVMYLTTRDVRLAVYEAWYQITLIPLDINFQFSR